MVISLTAKPVRLCRPGFDSQQGSITFFCFFNFSGHFMGQFNIWIPSSNFGHKNGQRCGQVHTQFCQGRPTTAPKLIGFV